MHDWQITPDEMAHICRALKASETMGPLPSTFIPMVTKPSIEDSFKEMLAIVNRRSDDAPRFIYCGTSFLASLRQCTQEEAEEWAMASPLATHLGGSLWQMAKRVEPGDHSRLEWA